MAELTRRYDGFVPGAFEIEGFGAGGFRFAGMSHRGSLIVLPSGIHMWAALTPADMTPDMLAPGFAEPVGTIELLLIGTGRELLPLRADLDPPGYLGWARRWQAAGAGIIGGCCGTDAEAIRKLAALVQ